MNLKAKFKIAKRETIKAKFVVNVRSAVTPWGNITGNIEDQIDLMQKLGEKADTSTVEDLSDEIDSIIEELDDKAEQDDLDITNSNLASLTQIVNTKANQSEVDDLNDALGILDEKVDNAISTESTHFNALSGDINDLANTVDDNKSTTDAAISQLNSNKANQSDLEALTGDVENLSGEVTYLTANKQDKLVSGTNIKTVNNQSLLGPGDIHTISQFSEIQGNPNDNTNLRNALIQKVDVSDFSDTSTINFNASSSEITANVIVSSDTKNIISIEDDGIYAEHQDLSNLATKAQITSLEGTSGSSLDYTGSTLSLKNKNNEVISTATIKSSPDVDGVSITYNSDEELQTDATILQSGGYQQYWEGTKSEFNAITNKDPNTLYQVLDDEESALFEVDGTTIEFSPDNILRIPNNIDLCISDQVYTYGNGLRKYRSGYCEQYGISTSSADGIAEFTIHEPYTNNLWSVQITVREIGNFFVSTEIISTNKFKLRICGSNGTPMAVTFDWYAIGHQ